MQLKPESIKPKSLGTEHGSIKNVVIIFSKAPVAGAVKTRLIQDSELDAEDAALLAEAMLKDTIVLSAESTASEIVIGFTPANERKFVEQIVKKVVKETHLEIPITFITQSGINFDERFGSVVSAAFATGSENVVILGADLPYLPPDIIDRAFLLLKEDRSSNSVVLGPAGEGGIYLLGITRHFDPEYFSKNQLFSGGVEISQFIKLCKDEGKFLKLLPAFTDVDIEADLVSLLLYVDAMRTAEKIEGFYFPSYTAGAITQLGLIVLEHSGETRNRSIGKMRAQPDC
ncbi:MAG: TIGR04282 family arsenosugar biosynthesis glycosyltransferase [Halobacteriota archaeon]